METVFRFFAKRHLVANLFTLIVIILGISTAARIKFDTFPEVDFGEMAISTSYPGASPEDVELKVTNKIEDELKQVSGLDRYASFSMENVSMISVFLDPDESDQEAVKRDVRDAVNRVTDLPLEVDEKPFVTEINTSIFPVIEVGISGELPYPELRDYARQFEKKLKNLPGVSRVERFGWRAREIQLEVDPKALKEYQLPLRDIIHAVKNRNIRSTGGAFESYTSERNIVTLAQFRKPEEVGDVILRSTFEGPLVKVKDLAVVKDDFEDESVRSRLLGKPAISFMAYKTSGADIVELVDDIKVLVEKQKELLPPEIQVLYSSDSSRYVRNRFSIVFSNGLVGLCLVCILLAVFLNIRTAFWAAMGIPVAVLGTIFMLPVFDRFLDSITLTALIIVVGIIVDDAIIVSESIYNRFEQGDSPLDAAVNGISAVFQPVITTILTTFLAFAPMFFMPGILGKFCLVIPLTISLALFISLIEVTLALPAHLVPSMAKHKKGSRSLQQGGFALCRKHYKRAMKFLLRFPQRYFVLVFSLLMLAGSGAYAFKCMDFILFPSSAADQFFIQMELPSGSSLDATSDKAAQVEKLLQSLPQEELSSFVTRIGTLTGGNTWSAESENYAVIAVDLTPHGMRTRTADKIVASLKEKTDKLEGFDKLTFEIDAGGPPVGRPITLRVVGSDDQLRDKLSDKIEEMLSKIPGAKDIDRNDKDGKSQLEIKIDYDRLARTGLSVADVAQTVRIAYDGEVVTDVRYGEEDVDFRIQFAKQARMDTDYLKTLLVPNRDNRLVPLEQVASFDVSPGPSNFYHYEGERTVAITGDVDKEITTPLKVTNEVLSSIDLDKDYPGMRIVVGGEAEETNKSIYDLFVALGIAAVAIYFLLIVLFNSVFQPLLVMIAMPFGVIGVIIAFALHNEPIGFLAVLGIIGLLGVVVNDSLVMVNHINELKDKKNAEGIVEVVAQGSTDRLRAIIMTTLTTVAGLLPLAYGIGGTDPYMTPMALALGFGLFFATPLTLMLVPALYVIGEDFSRGLGHLSGRRSDRLPD